MQICCPACQATYEVPDRLIAPGRRVRCAKCGENWVPAPAEPATPMEAVLAAMAAAPSAETAQALSAATGDLAPTHFPTLPPEEWGVVAPPPAELPSHAGPAGAGRGQGSAWPLRLAWAASLLLLLGLGAATWLYRGPIAVAWPPAMRLFAVLPGG